MTARKQDFFLFFFPSSSSSKRFNSTLLSRETHTTHVHFSLSSRGIAFKIVHSNRFPARAVSANFRLKVLYVTTSKVAPLLLKNVSNALATKSAAVVITSKSPSCTPLVFSRNRKKKSNNNRREVLVNF